MDIYENVIIGNFLFGLGLKVGWNSGGQALDPLCINLLQQTPCDESLADLMLASSRICLLVEFKRMRTDDSVGERAKRNRIEQVVSRSGMVAFSERVHWYIETDFTAQHSVNRVVEYLNFNTPRLGKSFLEFIDEVADRAASQAEDGDDRQQFKHYLQLVAKACGGETGSSGGLLVSVTASGQLKYIVLHDMRKRLPNAALSGMRI